MSKLLITGNIFKDEHYESLVRHGFEVKWIRSDLEKPLDELSLEQVLVDVDGYIMAGNEKLTSEAIVVAKKLKFVVVLANIHADFVDVESATHNKITVANTAGATAQAVAEMAIGFMVCATRMIPYFNSSVKKGIWRERPSNELHGRTLGILGLGAIGSIVAKIAREGFGMRVLYHSRTPKADLESKYGYTFVSLTNLLSDADVISLHCPLNQDTKEIINDSNILSVKKGAILVNTSRAWLVNPNTLYNALSSDHIRAAAFDVYYEEPPLLPDDDPFKLLSLGDDKFIISPHTSFLTTDSSYRLSQYAMEKLLAFFENFSDTVDTQ